MQTKRRSEKKKRREIDIPRMLTLLGIEFRQRNSELWAPCPHPDHYEKTASWSIDPYGGHYCFGCKWRGGSLELIRKRIGLSGYPACDAWVKEKGLYLDGPVPLAVKLQVNSGEVVMEMPTPARMKPLEEWITPAKRYAIERGLTAAQVARWGIGYATGGYYANRILLPTYSRTGELLNITGRAWSKTKTPKYLNSKESHGRDPGAIFGERYWPERATRSTLVLCEGELNALACERRGVEFVGALGGSQLQTEQVLKLGQFQRIILAMDMDHAGSDIAEKLRVTLSRWRKCETIQFPDRRDPNDLERDDPGLLDDLLQVA